MTTEAQLKSAAEFLAKELMGWKWCEIGKGYVFEDNPVSMYPHWQDSEGKFLCYPEKFNWTPYADTPEGWWQAKMMMEKMTERDFLLFIRQWTDGYETWFISPIDSKGWHMKAITLNAAITLAAATALGWKEE